MGFLTNLFFWGSDLRDPKFKTCQYDLSRPLDLVFARGLLFQGWPTNSLVALEIFSTKMPKKLSKLRHPYTSEFCSPMVWEDLVDICDEPLSWSQLHSIPTSNSHMAGRNSKSCRCWDATGTGIFVAHILPFHSQPAFGPSTYPVSIRLESYRLVEAVISTKYACKCWQPELQLTQVLPKPSKNLRLWNFARSRRLDETREM